MYVRLLMWLVLCAPAAAVASTLGETGVKWPGHDVAPAIVAGGHLSPDMDEYERLVDSLKSGQTMSVVQYGRLSAFGTRARGGWTTHASGSRRFTLRYVPAEGTFKVAVPGEEENTLSEERTLQDVMFNIGGLSLVCRQGLACGEKVFTGPGARSRLLLGVSWEPVVLKKDSSGVSRWLGGWVDLLTLRPLWQKPSRVEGETSLGA